MAKRNCVALTYVTPPLGESVWPLLQIRPTREPDVNPEPVRVNVVGVPEPAMEFGAMLATIGAGAVGGTTAIASRSRRMRVNR